MALRKKSVCILVILSLVLFSQPIAVHATVDDHLIVVPDDYLKLEDALKVADANDTILFKKGIYEGPVNATLVVAKSVTILGEGADETRLVLHPTWSLQGWNGLFPVYDYDQAIEVQANDVKISDLTISGDGGSLHLTGNRTIIRDAVLTLSLLAHGSNQSISNNTIKKEFHLSDSSSYSVIEANHFIEASAYIRGKSNVFCNNTVNGGYGLIVSDSGLGYPLSVGNLIFNNTIENCSYGVSVKVSGSNNFFYANRVLHNSVGLAISGIGNGTVFYANSVADNDYGVQVMDWAPMGYNNTFYCNNFLNNDKQVNTDLTIKVTGIEEIIKPAFQGGIFDNGKQGNYWSDYHGSDSNGDGIGDTAYVIDDNRSDHFPLMAPFDIDSASVNPPDWVQSEVKEGQIPQEVIIAAVSGVAIGIVAVGVLCLKKHKPKNIGKTT